MTLHVALAKTEHEIRDAQRVRFRVYVEEEGLSVPHRSGERLDEDARDFCANTIHVVVYDSAEPVATVRLLRPQTSADPERALRELDLSSRFRLDGFAGEGVRPAEVARYCVLRRYRGSRAAALLFRSLLAASAEHRITHWVAAANTQTDSARDAQILYPLAMRRGLTTTRFTARAIQRVEEHQDRQEPFREAQRRIYTPSQLALAAGGEYDDLDLPPILSLFARRMGARYMGAPVYDSRFGVYAMPLVSVVAEQRAPHAYRTTLRVRAAQVG